jgi:hypothetical protein
MNIMHLSASFEIKADAILSVRERARLFARKRLAGAVSVFDTMKPEEAAALIKSDEQVSFGAYDPADTSNHTDE